MKRSGCKSVISLLFIQLILILTVSVYADDVDKTITREFDASGIELLKIDNRYGDVEIVSSGNNKINIIVNVQLSHPNDSKAERLLSMVNVLFSENDNTIEARTDIDRQFQLNGTGSNRSFSIDYRVEMPEDMDIDISNRYGNINTGELSGHVDIRIKYGSLFIKKLSRGNKEPLNSVTAEYLRVGDIEDAGWLELNMRHVAKFNITSAQALLINSRYSINNTIDMVSSVVIDSQYDKFEIGQANNIVAESAYTSYKVGHLSNVLNIKTKYGSVDVDYVKPGFEQMKFDVEYTTVRLRIDESASYALTADTKYTGLSLDENKADIRQRIENNNSTYIEAVFGNADAKSEIIINAKYGSVKISER
ncbi:MAG: hypothetical protein U5K32_08070 [Bacteroidales bacterium]|nr:hypothetical protein [Bacteroidales bacterium]